MLAAVADLFIFATPVVVSGLIGGVVAFLIGRSVGPAFVVRAVPTYALGIYCVARLGLLGIVPGIAVFSLGTTLLTWWTLLRAAESPLTTVPLHVVPPPAWRHANALQTFGFVPVVGLHLTPKGLADQFLIVLVDPAHAAYAQINAITGSARQSVLVLSAFPGGVLRTTSSPVVMPAPSELVQAFTEAPVDVLLARHAEALAFLAAQGFHPLPAEVAQAEPFARHRVDEERQLVQRLRFGGVLRINKVSKRHRFPVTEQPAVGEVLEQWRRAGGLA